MKRTSLSIEKVRVYGGLMLALIGCANFGCARRLLIAEDVVFPQGRPAELAAAVDQQSLVIFTKGIPDTPVEFVLDNEPVAKAVTDKEGRAAVQPVPVQSQPTYKARANLGGKVVESTGRIYAWDPEKPAVAIDIDETLSLSEYINIIWGDGLVSKPLPGSPQAVQQLAKEYQIIYWSIRPRFMYHRTRRWLEKHGFPDGPMLFTDSFHAAFHQVERKEKMLAELREKWPNVRVAVGDKLADVVACNKTGIVPFIVNPLLPKFKHHAIVVPDWKTLMARSDAIRDASASPQDAGPVLQPPGRTSTLVDAQSEPDDASKSRQ